MIDQIFKIIFKKDRAYLTDDTPLDFDQVDIGYTAKIKTFQNPATWTVRVLKYDPAIRQINVEVLKYEIGDLGFTTFQKNFEKELKEITQVKFKGIDTNGLINTLSGGNDNKGEYRPRITSKKQSNLINISPLPHSINETLFIPIKNINFKNGEVTFSAKLKGYNKEIDLSIKNIDLREEYDAVKNYFENVLQTKKIEVRVKIELTDGIIKSTEVTSPEIERINAQLIENVKFNYLNSVRRISLAAESEKTLYTKDEFLKAFSDAAIKPNTFYVDDKQFFEDVITITNTKHYKHLRYLSSKHAHETMKLRIVQKPFSFVFLIQSTQFNFIIWETLDTQEATYLWQIDNSNETIKQTIARIETILFSIKVNGKIAYINSNEDGLIRITHDYSEKVDGFLKWKAELDSIIN